MPTAIHEDVLDNPAVLVFASTVRQLCELIETVDALPQVYLLQKLDGLLPMLYSLAQDIPDPYVWRERDADEEEFDLSDLPKEFFDLQQRLSMREEWTRKIAHKLGGHDLFRLVYDPMDRAAPDAIDGSLAGLIADIYVDLRSALNLYKADSSEEKAAAIWDWRIGMKHEWGAHAAEVMLPIHRLIHRHYDEDDEVFRI